MTLIDLALLKTRLGSLAGRFDVDALDECDSTSSELLRRAELGAPAGTVIVADWQHAGRGRRGRNWLSSPESSLTFSLLWRFSGNASGLSGLSLAVGVGLVHALESLGAQGVCLKWPNDVLLRSGDEYAKLAGILIELSFDGRGTQAIIGIGLNLESPPGELTQAAAGLVRACPHPADRHDVLAAILGHLAGVLDTFAEHRFFALKMEWQRYNAWQDQFVQILGEGEEPKIGRCLGVDASGALLLGTAAGVERILSGDVSLRPVASPHGAGLA
jgi:BirA family biotin operon repressor/biotin-[acetyl-CoA-carboxylase] ligase